MTEEIGEINSRYQRVGVFLVVCTLVTLAEITWKFSVVELPPYSLKIVFVCLLIFATSYIKVWNDVVNKALKEKKRRD